MQFAAQTVAWTVRITAWLAGFSGVCCAAFVGPVYGDNNHETQGRRDLLVVTDTQIEAVADLNQAAASCLP
jgi:hypothetical protein